MLKCEGLKCGSFVAGMENGDIMGEHVSYVSNTSQLYASSPLSIHRWVSHNHTEHMEQYCKISCLSSLLRQKASRYEYKECWLMATFCCPGMYVHDSMPHRVILKVPAVGRGEYLTVAVRLGNGACQCSSMQVMSSSPMLILKAPADVLRMASDMMLCSISSIW